MKSSALLVFLTFALSVHAQSIPATYPDRMDAKPIVLHHVIRHPFVVWDSGDGLGECMYAGDDMTVCGGEDPKDDITLATDTARWSLDYCRANLKGTAWYYNLFYHAWRQDDCADFIVKFSSIDLTRPPAKHHSAAPQLHHTHKPRKHGSAK